MNILFISRWFPCPPDNGSKIRVFNLIKQLAVHHNITLVSFVEKPISENNMAEMRRFCHSVFTVPYRPFNPTGLRAFCGLFSSRPRSLVDTFSSDMQALLEEQCSNNSPHVIVASQIETAVYAIQVAHPAKIFEELELAVPFEQFVSGTSIATKFRYGLTWWKLSHFLVTVLDNFQGCTVVSEQERDLVRRIKPEHDSVMVVPNGVDLEKNTGEFDPPRPDTLIYSGALTYSANFDAMEFFLNDIFPLVKASHPEVSLRITGGYNGVTVDRLPLVKGVQLTGYIEDIRPAVAQSWACVVPLRKGGGTRLKILEAMALGTPVISTSKGAEGLEVTHEQDILIADTPDAFGRAVVRLLNDVNLRARLSANGRKLVEESYSWGRSAQKLEQLIYRVMGNQRTEDGRQMQEVKLQPFGQYSGQAVQDDAETRRDGDAAR